MGFDNVTLEKITANQEGLVRLKAWLLDNPDVQGSYYGTTYSIDNSGLVVGEDGLKQWHEHDAADAARAVRRLTRGQPIGTVRVDHGETYRNYTLPLGGTVKVTYSIERKQVCEAKVIGTKIVKRPDPNAPMIEETVDDIVWECSPLLEEAEAG